MSDDLDILKPRPPIRLPYTVPGFWTGARAARLEIARAEEMQGRERDAAEHRRVGDDYQAIAAALAEGRTLEDLPEYATWRARTTMRGITA